jgi:hypothetical protein
MHFPHQSRAVISKVSLHSVLTSFLFAHSTTTREIIKATIPMATANKMRNWFLFGLFIFS